MATDVTTAPPPMSDESASRRIHWKTGLAILLIGGLIEYIVWRTAPDRTYQVMWSLSVVSGTAFALLVWWLFISGFRWRTRWIGLFLLCIVGAVLFAPNYGVFKFKRFRGEMWPVFGLRYAENAAIAEKREFFAEQKKRMKERSGDLPVVANEAAVNWPQFRGANRDGVVTESIRTDWNASPPDLVWRHPVGLGWSSFAIVDGLAYTQEQRDEMECVVCYDADTGDQIWLHEDQAKFSEAMGGVGPRATPTYHDGKLYTLGATGILNCLDAISGEKIWSRNILEDAQAPANLRWAMAGSPLIYDDLVVVNPGGGKDRGVIAYHVETGDIEFAAGDRAASYSAPRLVEIAGERQLLVFDATGLTGHDPTTGKELWHFPWDNSPQVNAIQPIVRSDYVFISCGYGKGSALLEVKQIDGKWSVEDKWSKENFFKMKFNDAAFHKGYLYGLDEGILSCVEYMTGRRMWKRGRYGYGQLLLVGDRLLIQEEKGAVALVEASPKGKGKELARFQAIEGTTWNHPVVYNGYLFVRNAEEAACYDLRMRE